MNSVYHKTNVLILEGIMNYMFDVHKIYGDINVQLHKWITNIQQNIEFTYKCAHNGTIKKVQWKKSPWSHLHFFVFNFLLRSNTLFTHVNVVDLVTQTHIQHIFFICPQRYDVPINYSSLLGEIIIYVVLRKWKGQ